MNISTETTSSAANEVAKTEHITSLLWILPELYLLFLHKPATFFLTHPWQSNIVPPPLRLDSTTFDISFSPDPTECHYCPYTTIGADINTGPHLTPRFYQPDAEDILNTITDNADNNLQHHERGKLGRMPKKPSTPNIPFIHGNEVIGELYRKNMVLIPFTIDPWAWARSGPMLQAIFTTTHHPSAKNPGAPHTLTTNITDPMPTSCTNAYPNHHAHSGSSYPPTSDGHKAICITNTTDILWQLLHCTHTKSTYSPTHWTQHI
jgi:hypothetical protein